MCMCFKVKSDSIVVSDVLIYEHLYVYMCVYKNVV